MIKLHFNSTKKESEVTHMCPTVCNPMDCSPPGYSVHGIFQARILEGIAISFSREGIFPTQGSNPGLLRCRQTLYPLSHQGSPSTKSGSKKEMGRGFLDGLLAKTPHSQSTGPLFDPWSGN